MKQFNPKINSIFKPMRNIQILMMVLFEVNVVVRYVLLMGIQKTIDSIGVERVDATQQYLKLCFILIAAFFVLNGIFQYWYRYLEYTSQYALMKGLFGMTIKKSCTFHEKYPAASALTMIKDDSRFIADWKGMGMLTLVLNMFSLVIAFGMMLYYSVRITLVIGFIILACYVYTHCISKAISDRTYKLQESNTEISSRIVEYLEGVRDIKQYQKEAFFEKRLADYIDEHSFKHSKSISRLYAAFTSTYVVLAIAVPILVVLIGVTLVMEGRLTIGELIALYGIAGTLQEPVQVIPEFFNKRAQALAMQEKVEPILKEEQAKYKEPALGEMETFSFDSEHYTFKDGKMILEDVEFILRRGEPAVVKGPSGRGKTSLLNVISRFYDTEGQPVEMKYNGIPVRDIQPEAYYRHVRQSQQSPYIFCDTVLNNLTLGEDFSKEEIDAAVKAACLEDFIENRGFDFMISHNGSNISGGQKQRLGLARALLRKPDLLMLDEPTSALNPEMAASVTEGVARYCERWKIALLVVSHHDSFEQYYRKKEKEYGNVTLV